MLCSKPTLNSELTRLKPTTTNTVCPLDRKVIAVNFVSRLVSLLQVTDRAGPGNSELVTRRERIFNLTQQLLKKAALNEAQLYRRIC